MRKKLFAACSGLFLLLCLWDTAYAIMADGKDWRQLTDTVNLSYNDLAQIYDTSTGQLKDSTVTTVGGVDFSGWIWASLEEVASLYSSFSGLTIGVYESVREAGSAWAPEYFNLFEPTSSSSYHGYEQAVGTSRTLWPNGLTTPTVMQNRLDDSIEDVVHTNGSWGLDTKMDSAGFHMYKAASVPIPGAVSLLGAGLLMLALVRRRKVFPENR